MSRYTAPPPFTPHADFEVARPLTMNGRKYEPGDQLIKDAMSERLLRNLYDQRRITMIIPEPMAAAKRHPLDHDGDGRKGGSLPRTAGAQAPSQAPAATTPAEPAEVAPVAAPAAPAEAPRYRIKHAGLGGYKVIDASGAPVGKGHKTKEEAQAEIDRLLAQ